MMAVTGKTGQAGQAGQDHFPVMLDEVLAALAPAAGEIHVDGTFGAGGYSRAILAAAPGCRVIGIDRDEQARPRAQALQGELAAQGHDPQALIFAQGCFGDALSLVQGAGFAQVDGFVLDLGVSSMQLDEAERGFSFRFDGPLDMRMQRDDALPTAADIVNNMDEAELVRIIKLYGQERFARRVARRITEARKDSPFETTAQLADIVRAAVPRSPKDKIDPATRTFQALRIYVNDELGELERGLAAAEALLKPGGRLVVVSFHSLEDKIVKSFLYERAGRIGRGSRYLPETSAPPAPRFTMPQSKAFFPSDEETKRNARSRSARMRVGVRTAEPATGKGGGGE